MMSPALVVVASLVGLAVGPVLFAAERRSRLWFDGVAGGVVPAIILFRLLPDLFEESGMPTLVFAGAGFAAVGLFGHRHDGAGPNHRHHHVVLPALAAHSFLDGTTSTLTLAATEGTTATLFLVAGFMLHRMSEGLFVITLVGRNIRKALPRIGLIAMATIFGSLGGSALVEQLPRTWLNGFIALGLGMVLRIAIQHRGPFLTRIVSVLRQARGGGKAVEEAVCTGALQPDHICSKCS